jgi:hypothetical protein
VPSYKVHIILTIEHEVTVEATGVAAAIEEARWLARREGDVIDTDTRAREMSE